MTKLFLITVRWMKKDRKRTLLSFLSILLAVYMMTILGIYFSSSLCILRSNEKMSQGDYHIKIRCENSEQAEKISMNAAVSKSTYYFDAYPNVVQGYLEKYADKNKGGSENYIPSLTLNGKGKINWDFAYIEGKTNDMIGSEDENGSRISLVSGRLPEKEGEIVIPSAVAESQEWGEFSIGSEAVFRYEVRKGTIDYAEYKEIPSENGPKKEYLTKDEKGEPAAIEDKEGKYIKKLVDEMRYEYTRSSDPKSSHSNYYLFLLSLLTDPNGNPLEMAYDNDTYYGYNYVDSNNDICWLTAKARDLSEPVELVEYKAKVVGICDNYQIYLSGNDTKAQELFRKGAGYSYVRIKEGLDIDEEQQQILKNAGLKDEYTDAELNVKRETAQQHDLLLFYEGKSLYNPSMGSPMFILGVFTLILVVFVFFARLIINNAFELSSAYRLAQYGALKTVGVSNRQMFFMVMGECLLYLVTALPVAVGLAFLTGKLIISKIMSIKIFDALYGAGVTERFFSLEISPGLMALVLFVTVFSVIMSAYAAAIRIIKLPAVQTAASQTGKPPKPVKRSWLTRKLFGISAGYAARSAFRNKSRFFITLLATVMSATMVVIIATMIDVLSKQKDEFFMKDYEVQIVSDFTDEDNASDNYKKIKESGLFDTSDTDIFPRAKIIIYSSGEIDDLLKNDCLTDEYIKGVKEKAVNGNSFGIKIMSVSPQEYSTYVGADMSYEELVKKGGILVSSSVRDWVYDGSSPEGKPKTLSYKSIKSGTDKLSITLNRSTETAEDGSLQTEPVDFDIKVSGIYTPLIPDDDMYCSQTTVTCIIPLENMYSFLKSLGFDKEKLKSLMTDAPYYQGVYFDEAEMENIFVDVNCVKGKKDEAEQFLKDTIGVDIVDNTAIKHTNENISKALRIAGLSLAAIVFAVAMINIISTSATEIVNRRRELSMLRACGMTLKQVMKSLTIEAVVYALLATAASSALGIWMGHLVLAALDVDIYVSTMPSTAILGVFALIAGLMLASYMLPLRSMARTPVAQDIRSKE